MGDDAERPSHVTGPRGGTDDLAPAPEPRVASERTALHESPRRVANSTTATRSPGSWLSLTPTSARPAPRSWRKSASTAEGLVERTKQMFPDFSPLFLPRPGRNPVNSDES